MIKEAKSITKAAINETNKKIKQLANKYRKISMLSRTHGQSASPTTMGKEFKRIIYGVILLTRK